MSSSDDRLLSGNYDGIQEFDNDLPRWWVGLFWATIIFGAFYTAYYSFGPGRSPNEQLAVDMEELKVVREHAEAAKPALVDTEDSLVALAKNADTVAKGKAVFDLRCAPCHGPQGQGVVGPNLTDNFWIHGGKITDTLHVVQKGVLDKGMLAWEGVIPPDELRAVVAYIYTLRGSSPPNPKAPQGDPAA